MHDAAPTPTPTQAEMQMHQRLRLRPRHHPNHNHRHRPRAASVSSQSDSDGGIGDTPETAAAKPGKALGFEHLEAIRNVEMLQRNEYPLPHLPRERVRRTEDLNAKCYCTYPGDDDATADRPRCEDVSCLNFATYIECTASQCEAREYCRNQRLQHPRDFPQLEAFKTEHKGYGVRTCEFIKQGRVLGEYLGEVIDQAELASRLKGMPKHELNFYYLELSPGVYIDARKKGSFTRFVNHSCEPNCRTEKWTVKGEMRIAVVAIRDIAQMEELTFDYQWKSLGSRQIKCYCGSANCKGFIGAESDQIEPEGYFREPSKEERGAALVTRRVRIFPSSVEASFFLVAYVRAYDEKTDTYDLDYEDECSTPEEAFDSPSSGMDDIRKQSTVKLCDYSWHVYAELHGLSEDQIQQSIFSIPKRQAQGSTDKSVSSTASSPVKSPSVTTEEVAPPTPVRRRRSHNAEGERLNNDGDVITTKLLVKGVPRSCSEAKLRAMFVYKDPHSSSAPRDVVVSLDMFYFDDLSGWALVELKEAALVPIFKRNLNSRMLSQRQLRVYAASQKEVDTFKRTKRHMGLHTPTHEQTSQASTTNAAAERAPVPYCYGRKLNWIVNVEQVEDSPTRRGGWSQSVEESTRTKCVKFIFRLAKSLHLDREDATSAIIALHRYFTFHSMKGNDVEMAAGMLHLYLEAHARKFVWDVFVSEAYHANNQLSTSASSSTSSSATERLDPHSREFKRMAGQILRFEKDLLSGVLFDLKREDPFSLLDLLTTSKVRNRSVSIGAVGTPPSEVQKEAKHLLSDTFRLPVWACVKMECVVLSVFYVAAAVVEARRPGDYREDLWTPADIPTFLPFLDSARNEKESILLMDCSSRIVDSAMERWIRQEKNASAAKTRRANELEEFDTEAFVVQTHKLLEITQRVRLILEKWINVKDESRSSASRWDRRSSEKNGSTPITLDDLARSVSGSCHTTDLPEAPLVSSILSSESRSTKSSAVASDKKLFVDEIENVETIRKRVYLGTIPGNCGLDCAGKRVLLQPWPYREHEPLFRAEGGVSSACLRELSAASSLAGHEPEGGGRFLGIIFAAKKGNDVQATDDLLGFADESVSRGHGLRHSEHYLAFEQPLHLYSGLVDSRVEVPMELRKRAFFEMLQDLQLCHDSNFVHRYVSLAHVLVYKNHIKLGGWQAIRRCSPKIKDTYELNETERKEHCHGSWLQITAPEILLGEKQYSWRSDMWSAGCVALAILFSKLAFFQGSDVKTQLSLIYRLCGTPGTEWEQGTQLSQYSRFRPKHEYRRRVRKTLLEYKHEKKLSFDEASIDVLEKMLQLDPNQRLCPRRLLEMDYFADIRKNNDKADFSILPAMESLKREEIQPHAAKYKTSSSKRRHNGEMERVSSRSGSSKRHPSSSASRHSAKRDKDGDVRMEDGENVPLPDSLTRLNHHEHDDATDLSKSHSGIKRAKLGWGEGLGAHN